MAADSHPIGHVPQVQALLLDHNDVMAWKHFPIFGPLQRNPPIIGWLPHKGPVIWSLDISFVCYAGQAIEPKVKFLVKWDAMTPMWHQCNATLSHYLRRMHYELTQFVVVRQEAESFVRYLPGNMYCGKFFFVLLWYWYHEIWSRLMLLV